MVIEGDNVLPAEWVVFAPLEASAGVPTGAFPPGVPDVIESGDRVYSPRGDGIVRLRRGVMRPDGFVSLHSPITAVGEVLTRPLLFGGSRLHLNYATSAVGTIRIGVYDQQGRSIKGFSLDDSEILFGNEADHPCRWLGGDDLGRLAGQPIRLRIRLHDADIFSLHFC